MNTKQLPDDFPEVQESIYGAALSLDAFLLNGISYGVIHRDVLNGFLEKTAGNLLRDLAKLEEHAPHAPAASQSKVTTLMTALRARCQQMIDLVTELSSFRNFSPEQLRSTVSQVPLLREQCIQLIQELEHCFRTPKPFYPSRSPYLTDAMNGFLANLERMFVEEWTASAEKHKSTAS
jgi:hypothetical protein